MAVEALGSLSDSRVLSATFLWASRRRRLGELLERQPIFSRAIRRFVGGETTEEMVTVARELKASSLATTVDHLGEAVHSSEESKAATKECQATQSALTAAGLDRSVSVKLTQLGLEVSEDVAAGAWSSDLLGTLDAHVPIQAGHGYAITVTGPARGLRRPTYLAETRIACTPFDSELRFAGLMELNGLEMALAPRRFGAIRRGVDEYLIGWRGSVEKEWGDRGR